MSNKVDPFSINSYDLGSKHSSTDKATIDQSFRLSSTGYSHTCIICSQAPKYRLIPKHTHLNTAQIEDKGFICEHCISQGCINPMDYGLRELS